MTDPDSGEEPDGIVGPGGELSPHPRRPGHHWPTLPPKPPAGPPAQTSPPTPDPVRAGSKPLHTRNRDWGPPPDLPETEQQEGGLVGFLKGSLWKVAGLLVAIPLFAILGVQQCQSQLSGVAEIAELPGVTAVDSDQQRIVLSTTITRDQARQVVDRAYGLQPGWELVQDDVSMMIMKRKSTYTAPADLYPPLDVLLALGQADLTRFADIQVSLQSIPGIFVMAEVRTGQQPVPAARELLDAMADVTSDRTRPLQVHGDFGYLIFDRLPAPPAALDALAELPEFAGASFGDENAVALRTTPDDAARDCRKAATIFAARKLDVRLTYVTEPGPNPAEHPC
ncbi:hypothetical protein [Microlunatus sp. GCM10028923]|uniref:hypothetical protein n=1 Tax=Microlunatus sp. GCM10028923 TaxID=3273400 RepID=UPI0036213E0C